MSADTTTPNATTNGTPHLSKFVDDAEQLLRQLEGLRHIMFRLEMKRVELDPMARGQIEDALTNVESGLRSTGRALDFYRIKFLS